MRSELSFISEGLRCAAWFYQPESRTPAPVVVLAHGLGAVRQMRLDAYAERFCAAGYACLVFDYRHFGDSEGEPRQLLDIRLQHEDWHRAIAYARTLPGVDAGRVVLWGSSLSGGHVLKVASEASNIAAVIAQVPHLSGPASLRMNRVGKILQLSLHGGYDLARGLLGLAPHYIPSSGGPGELALMTAPGESEGYLNLMPPGQVLDRRVSARFALQIGLYSPVTALRKLKMPVLLQVGERDVTTPAAPAIAAARGRVNVTLKRYDTGHFQPYVEPMFSTIIQDQLAFLKDALGSPLPA